MESIAEPLAAKAESLRNLLREIGPCAIGFSGGVDSSVLLKVAVEELGERAIGVLAVSPSLPSEELSDAAALAEEIGAPLKVIRTEETADPRYLANDGRRCYFCKSELWDRVWAVAREEGLGAVCEGANLDDVSDYRPGLAAAAERSVRAPLREVGFTKVEVRELARALGLRVAEKPSSPCLSSRIPHGSFVTLQKLKQIGQAERVLKGLGFAECRVRHFEALAVIAVPQKDLARLTEHAPEISLALREIGFHFVTADLEGLVSGSLNRLLGAGIHGA